MSIKISTNAIILITTILFLFFTAATQVEAQQTIFHDNFDDGNADGWIIVRNMQWLNPSEPCMYLGEPAQWIVENGRLGIRINGPACVTDYVVGTPILEGINSYVYEFDMEMPDSIDRDRNFIFKFLDLDNWYGYHFYSSTKSIEKIVDGQGYSFPPMDFDFQPNRTYHFRVEVLGTERIIVYVDGQLSQDVLDEPPSFLPTTLGMRAGVGAMNLTEVWVDNVVVKDLSREGFDLPFVYAGRPAATNQQFKSAFWKKLTAAFDHVLRTNIFRPFTGQTYTLRNCLPGTTGISCYDSHNGTDFSRRGGKEVLSVADGTVVFTSEHTRRNCTPNRGGFGCVVIVEYPENIFGLYAHLNKISVDEGAEVNVNSVLGVMGNTGCPTCGVHLHFGVLKPVGLATSLEMRKGYIASRMSKNDWNDLLYQARSEQTPIPRYRPYCTYKAPNGQRFNFQDPSGWKGSDTDPWSMPTSEGGCGVESPYLWKFDVSPSP